MKKIIGGYVTKVEGLFIGTPKEDSKVPVKTAIGKLECDIITIKFDKIVGDKCFNLKYHGGLNRVLHQYSSDHYSYWGRKFTKIHFYRGCLGENLSASGMDETTVCIGDIYKIGSVECVVTEPRKPCVTINQKLDEKTLFQNILKEGKTGWFYKILKEGDIKRGDDIELISRSYPHLKLNKCTSILTGNKDAELLNQMIQNSILSETWRSIAQKKIDSLGV